MNVKHFSLLVRLGMLLLFFPFSGHLYSQQITISGNIEFFVAGNQGLQVPDGFVVKDNAKNIIPPTLVLSDGAVLLDAATALYKVHSVPASGSAVFYSAFPLNARTATDRSAVSIASTSVLSGAKAGLTVVNGASGGSDFTLKLDAATGLGTSSLPVVWEVSQTAGSGIGDLIFSWDASLETSTLANKRLYRYVSGAWTVLPAANTTAGTNSLTYSGYTDVLSSTRFGIASGLTVTPTPTDPLCTGGAGSLTVSASGGLGTRSYKLNNGTWQSSGQFSNLAAGTYTVYVKDDAGDEVSEMVTITDPPPVTANVTGDLTVCAGETTTLTATGGTSYLWNGTLGTNAAVMVSPTTNTTYSVSVTDANNCLSTASVTVTVNSLPTASIGGTTTICNGANTTLTASGASMYAWSGSLGSNASVIVSPTSTSTYTVTVTDGNSCTDIETATVTVNSLPTASISGTTTICSGSSTTLTAAGAPGYAWSGSLGSNASVMVSPTSLTTYTVTVTDGNGCTDTETATVTVNSLPTASVNGDLTVCTGETTTLTATGGTSYLWNGTLGTNAAIMVSPTSNTTYSVSVTDANNCLSTASVTVTVNTLPTASIGGTTTICNGANTTLTASGASMYAWSGSLGSNASVIVSPTSTATYTVTVTDGNACTDTETATVTVNSLPTASISGTTTICSGSSTTLTAAGAPGYAWSGSLGSNVSVMVSPTSTTTYTVTVTDGNGCTDTETATVTVNSLPTVSINGDLTVCSGETTTLTATGGTSYLWNGTLGTNAAIMVSPTSNTTYSVSVTDANNCLSTASVTIQISAVQPPVITFTDNTGLNNNDGTICAGSNAMVNITGAVSYSWSDGSTASSRTLTPACTTPYSVTVTDANGCTTTSNLQISVSFEPSVTQITPTAGSAGTTITINGKNLDNVSAVKINGQSASGLVIVSTTQLKANLPSGGPVTELQMVSPCGTTTVQVSTPTITSFTPGAGNPGTIITITGTNLDQLVSASAGGKSAIILSRAATTARILVMPGATTGVVSVTSATATASAASSFTVNTTPFPYFQQGARITNSSTNAVQGSSVSVSADGNTAIIGAPGDDSNKGAAWIYVRNGTAWSQQAKLVGTGAVGAARQGTGVAISANGNTAVVGGPADNSNAGAIWVFTRNGTTWTQQGNKLIGSGALGAAQQGISVAVSGDGNTVASGGFADDNYKGAAWAFARYGNNWAQVGDKITGNDFTGAARQGSSLSLNGDGTRLMMGGYQDNNRQGAAWIFGTDGCEWTQLVPKLVGTGGTSQAWQGFSVSLSADGNTAVTGGNSDSNLAGAAWVYTYSGSAWAQQARLVGAQAAGAARQGSSVTLSADGNTVMVGGNGDDNNKGAVWVYRKTGANWTQQGAKIRGSNAAGPAKQGSSVSVSANGTTAVIGGPNDNINKGAFWVYIPATSIPSMQQVLLEERAATTDALRLDQNTPNPFTGSTTITFSVPEACMAEWEITDVSGRVIHLLRRAYSGGENTEIFDLSGNSGVFYYRLKTPFGTESRKMLIVR